MRGRRTFRAMYQSFDIPRDPTVGPTRLALLRARLAALSLDGFLVPRTDEHQNEYLPACAERVQWLTGFTGSAATVIVLSGTAAIFLDGRYTLQAVDEVDATAFEHVALAETSPGQWLAAHLTQGLALGYDPMLHTVAGLKRLKAIVADAGARLVPVAANPIDAIWTDRPAPPAGAISIQPAELAGETAEDKLARLATLLTQEKVDACVLTQPDSIAWAFNIRGHDVPHTPLPLSFAILKATGKPQLFIAAAKLSDAVRARLETLAELAAPEAFLPALAALGSAVARVRIDPETTAIAIADAVSAAGGDLVEGPDPVTLPKAIKNAGEIAGTTAAHVRDGAALVRFLAWFDAHSADPGLTEIDVTTRLEAFRAETGRLEDLSFPTISGSGPNGAIVHYHVSRETNRPLDRDSLFLIDSGAQYRDGTTDVTRTLAMGTPTAEMRDRYTRVLKGHVAISRARFPKGTSGAQLDALARLPLWTAGLDFDHGTGHGVGAFLSVHEGPQRISKLGTATLEPGMIVSNEPGYYKTGAFGIRIENLVLVTPAAELPGGERAMLGFETLTLAPYDRRLIAAALLTADEIAWIDGYHARVRETLTPLVDAATAAWLAAATAPLAG